MTVSPLLAEPGRVDEPRAAQEYSEVLTRVAAEGRPVIVRRNGADLAAVIPLEWLDLLREAAARRAGSPSVAVVFAASSFEDGPAK